MKKIILMSILTSLSMPVFAADSGDVILGVIGGGVAGALITNEEHKKTKTALRTCRARLANAQNKSPKVITKTVKGDTVVKTDKKPYFYVNRLCTNSKKTCIGDKGITQRGNQIKVVGIYKDGDVAVVATAKSKRDHKVYKRTEFEIKWTERGYVSKQKNQAVVAVPAANADLVFSTCLEKVKSSVKVAAQIEGELESRDGLTAIVENKDAVPTEGAEFIFPEVQVVSNSFPPVAGRYQVVVTSKPGGQCSIESVSAIK